MGSQGEDPAKSGRTFRERLLELALEHEALESKVRRQTSKEAPDSKVTFHLVEKDEKSGIHAPYGSFDVHGSSKTLGSSPVQASNSMGDVSNYFPRADSAMTCSVAEQGASQSTRSLNMDQLLERQNSSSRRLNHRASTGQSPSLFPRRQRAQNTMRFSKSDKEGAEKYALEVWAILDPGDTGFITSVAMSRLLAIYASSTESHMFRSEPETRVFMDRVVEKLEDDTGTGKLSKGAFMEVMMADTLTVFGAELAESVLMFRESMFSLKMGQLVVSRAHLQMDLTSVVSGTPSEGQQAARAMTLLEWLDAIVLFVIIANAVLIGVSHDTKPEAQFWNHVEIGFTAFFLFEMIAKIMLNGFVQHFFGLGWEWNVFDAILVVVAVIDSAPSIIAEINGSEYESKISQLTLLRVARLLRISRGVRHLRLNMLRELQLMINGLMYGLRTIAWAIVLLGIVSYALALLLKQITEDDGLSYNQLFKDVPTSMFTVYRCFIGDCSTPDGFPLAHHLAQKYGTIFSMGYVLATMVVTLGLFNLIMAIFVESTLLLAKKEERKRHANLTLEKLRVARKIHSLVMKIMRAHQEEGAPAKRQEGLLGHWLCLRYWLRPESTVPIDPSTAWRDSVSREHFDRAMLDPEMQEILQDLQVSVTETSRVFDALDANGDGSLQLVELVEGLLMLRGRADKLDMLETRAAVRDIQVQLADLQHRLTVLPTVGTGAFNQSPQPKGPENGLQPPTTANGLLLQLPIDKRTAVRPLPDRASSLPRTAGDDTLIFPV